MSLFDFLAQASFWQWCGIILLAAIAGKCTADAIGNWRWIDNSTVNKTKNVNAGLKKDAP